MAFYPQVDCVYMKNLEFVALIVYEKSCLDMTDRRTDERADERTDGRTDGRTWLNRFIKNIYNRHMLIGISSRNLRQVRTKLYVM